MGLRRLSAAVAGLLLAAGLPSPAMAQNPSGPKSAVPFELVSNFAIVVRGQLGDRDGLKFILDTGSSYSAIDRRVADRLGLRPRPGTVFNFDRNLPIEWADVPELRVGPLRAAGIEMMVARLADLSDFAQDVDGIIGMDVLRRARKLSIDYEAKTISFTLVDEPVTPSPAAGSFVVPVMIQGTPLRLLVDTGFEYLLLYRNRLRSALPHLRIAGEPRHATLGRLQAVQVDLPGVQIGAPEALTPVLLLEPPRHADLDGVDGYLGPAALHARRLELDFAGKTLRWH